MKINVRLPDARSFHVQRRSAFTLIELLVVVAIIGILAGLLLPTLGRAKERGRAIACLNNVKQLQLCWQLYTDDHQGELPPNNWVAGVSGNNSTTYTIELQERAWCYGDVRLDWQSSTVTNGVLFPYNTSMAIYRCPSDPSKVQSPDGPISRLRSYNMNLWLASDQAKEMIKTYSWRSDLSAAYDADRINSPTTLCIRKLSQIPRQSEIFVFADVHEEAIIDPTFGVFPRDGGNANYWLDFPAERHGRRSSFSFVDGHVEQWRWKAPKKFEGWVQAASTSAESADLTRVQNATVSWAEFAKAVLDSAQLR